MEINADFGARATAHAAAMDWIASPMAGVERKMLDRVGGEVARATSIVRYAPGSHFSAHTHGGGEEFLVLDGVFQDESGDFPAGAYVRNPPGSSHIPGSEPGCVILVKLWQFDPDDKDWVRVAPGEARFAPAAAGVETAALHADGREAVAFERWAPGATVARDLPGGAEIFVLEGGFEEAGETFAPWSWLRLPAGARLQATAGPEGARLWIKTGHLAGELRLPG